MDLTSFDPATGEPLGSVPISSPEQVAAAVGRASAAQPAWAALTFAERAELLTHGAAGLSDDEERLGELLSREMGKPLREAVGEVASCGEVADELLEIERALSPEVLRTERVVTELLHEPYGVCAAITPWNYPASMISWMALPALMAGNTVVVKPSEETPLIAQAWVDAFNRALPEGVLQIVHGRAATGRALVGDPRVGLVAFTGSRATGTSILQAVAPRLTRVILELGGKDPMVVLPDADVQAAAKFAVRNSFRNCGQVCVSTERIYVHESIAEAFEAEVVRRTGELVVGHGMGEGVEIGPMISERQRDHVIAQIEQALGAGARLLAGGAEAHGQFIAPTVLADVTHDMDVMREETFGPVACIARYGSVDEAVALANDSIYGLGATVWGNEEAQTVARRIQAGMVGINRGIGGAPGSPWVGVKQSGFGFHGGPHGHRQFAQARIVSRPA